MGTRDVSGIVHGDGHACMVPMHVVGDFGIPMGMSMTRVWWL